MKWYQKSIWAVLLSLLFFPAGIFLVWRYHKTWYTKARITVAAVGAAVFLAEIGIIAYIWINRPVYVWVDHTANCYHRIKNCSNMDEPYRVTLEEAVSLKKRACRDCVQD